MALDLGNGLAVSMTLVSNEFIDEFMTSANGEYVKVYLYILRHDKEAIELATIAEALNHTEADVRRALAYWEKAGVLSRARQRGIAEESAAAKMSSPRDGKGRSGAEAANLTREPKRPSYTADDINRLAADEDFSQLLYIAQKYMNKAFTPRESETFAYLYDGLHMSAELLEYLVEYCAQNMHTSVRYIEAVALDWHSKGFTTPEQAKSYSESFTRDIFSVMKAFGINDRKPGETEKSMIETWFQSYGFSRELVIEACNRTLEATHNPSFKYADKILSEWNKAGVRTLSDVVELDGRRKSQNASRKRETGKTKDTNKFHNFEQNSYDYDEMVWNMIKEQ